MNSRHSIPLWLALLGLLTAALPSGAQVPPVAAPGSVVNTNAQRDLRELLRERSRLAPGAQPPAPEAVIPAVVGNGSAIGSTTNPEAPVGPTPGAPSAGLPGEPAIRRPLIPVQSQATGAPAFPGFPAPGAPSASPQPGPPAGILPPNVTDTNNPAVSAILGSPVSGTPLNPALNPNEVVPAGTIAANEMPLNQFFEIYAQYSGRTILRPSALPAAAVTLLAQTDLTLIEVVEAMDGVLALNGVTMIPIGEKFVKAVPSTTADREGAPISDMAREQMPLSEQFITKIVKLKNAKPSEIATMLVGFSKSQNAVTPIDSNSTLVLRDFSSNVKRMLEIIEKVDVMPEKDFSLEVIPIRYGKVTDIYATMSALISGGGGGGGGAGTAGAFAGAGMAGGRSMGGGGGFGAGNFGGGGRTGGGSYGRGGGSSYNRGGYNSGGGGYGGQVYPYELNRDELHANGDMIVPMQVAPGAGQAAGAAQNNFQRRLNDIVSRASTPPEMQILEGANIVPDERSNKLLIFANKRDMSMITNIVDKVDVLLAQVLIEAIILEVKLGDSLKVGVSASQSPKRFSGDVSGAGSVNNGQSLLSGLTNFPGSSPEGFNYFGRVGDNLDIAINAVAKDSQINIVSRPRIQTSHAIPGYFEIGETVPYITGFTDYGGIVGSGLSTRSQVAERPIGLSLDVTPYITPEGLIVMEIMQNFDQRGNDVQIDGNPYPIINTRTASAMLTVRDGDVIMLGGFISENKSTSKSGVPFLKDIPGLGVLFRSKNNSNDRTELIILMRATVLETPEAAAILARKERGDMPGVRQAEHEFKQSEAARQEKVDKQTKKKGWFKK